MTELNNRECIARIESNNILLPAFKATTIDYKGIPRTKEFLNEMDKNNITSNNSIKKKTNFSLDANINLKDILLANSTSRKVVK